jgi:hypothetical protein
LIHRADYQVLLYEAAKQSGATIVLGAVVDHVDERAPAVTLQDGRRIEADLIVGADGISSFYYFPFLSLFFFFFFLLFSFSFPLLSEKFNAY